MIRPVRLRLSRVKGFSLQALSLTTNGLPAINVARPSKWGNPFSVHPQHKPGHAWNNGSTYSVPTVDDAVACFAEMIAADTQPGTRAFELRRILPELNGRNLACWCAVIDRHGKYTPCHADVILSLANNISCEEVRSENIRWAKRETVR